VVTTPKKRRYMKVWRARNKQRIRTNWRRWATKNAARLTAKGKARTPEQRKRFYDKWYAKNRDVQLAKRRQRYQDNLDSERARSREWDAANREKRIAKDHKRRAQKLKTQIRPVDFGRVLKRSRGICGICKRRFDTNSTLHFDHIIPLSKGGPHTEQNLQAAHAYCNLSKGNRAA
jgi:5-methylcytosine-specific restriction endonuclease McrA